MLEEKRLVDAEGWVPLPGEYLQTLIAAFLATPAPLIPLGAVPLPHAPCAPCPLCPMLLQSREPPGGMEGGSHGWDPRDREGEEVRRGQGPVK